MIPAVILVLTTLPDRDTALQLADALVRGRLAACVSIGAPVQSIYHWRARIETGHEVPIVIKTRSALYTNVEDAIRKIHPYDTPEVIALRLTAGTPRYLQWIDDAVALTGSEED